MGLRKPYVCDDKEIDHAGKDHHCHLEEVIITMDAPSRKVNLEHHFANLSMLDRGFAKSLERL